MVFPSKPFSMKPMIQYLVGAAAVVVIIAGMKVGATLINQILGLPGAVLGVPLTMVVFRIFDDLSKMEI